jgi:CheY-like chemotaxis protein
LSLKVICRENFPAETVRVLVAEDNAVSARILDAFLDRMGCSATLTADGKEALRVACAQRFSVAIVDLSMPELDGFDFALRYRRQERGADHLPIIALTADAAEQVTDRCLSAGMDGILTKPIMYDRLVAVIQQYTRKPPVAP